MVAEAVQRVLEHLLWFDTNQSVCQIGNILYLHQRFTRPIQIEPSLACVINYEIRSKKAEM